MKYEKQRIAPLLFTVYSAAASGRSPALPCFAAVLVLVRFSGLFAFTQFIFQTRKVVYMSVTEISKKWTMPVRDWGLAYAQFMIYFEDRFAA